MKRPILLSRLKYFIDPHPRLFPAGEKVYLPKNKLTIRFWCEGSLRVEGNKHTLQINLNDSELLVLAVTTKEGSSVFRIPWTRVVAIELKDTGSASKRDFGRIFLN